MESSYSAFLSDPFLSCVGSMMKIDETWCQPLSSEGGTLLRSPIIHSASAKKVCTAAQFQRSKLNLHIIWELYPKGLFYQTFLC